MSPRPPLAHAVILAGGRGTRFWPRSRARTPKQLLNIVGERTMLQQTVARLAPAFPPVRILVVTHDDQAAAVRRQLPALARAHILAEPVGRNTTAAIGLAAVHLQHQSGDVLMAVLPADHYIGKPARFLRLIRAALQVAALGENMVVLGVPPDRPETGYGYIEHSARATMRAEGFAVYRAGRFVEKPRHALARRYLSSGRYFWNAGMFFWRVSTFLRNLEEFLPATHRGLMHLAEHIGTPGYARALRRIYPKLENISVDYAVLEPATRPKSARSVFVLPADVGWSDIGSWASVYKLLARSEGQNVSPGQFFALDAHGNLFWSPKKFLAAVGVSDLVVVETPDALLLCPRDRAQDVGGIVKWLERQRLDDLL